MPARIAHRPATAASVVFDLLNPIPFGFFVAALIFDLMYSKTAEVMWFKSAAWLISIGLFIAVVPRLINLFQVWFHHGAADAGHRRAAFFAYLLGVIAAIVNAFVHSRDAYSVVPDGLWLSVLTVVLLAAAHVLAGLQPPTLYVEERA